MPVTPLFFDVAVDPHREGKTHLGQFGWMLVIDSTAWLTTSVVAVFLALALLLICI